MITILVVLALAIAAAAAWWFMRMNLRGKPAPLSLRPGQKLPSFSAEDEYGNAVSTADLAGSPAVMLFVRGNWCPFCTRQVEDLTGYYKAINELGARLILVTPKPLGTTRRVAEVFGVDFDFWLDPDLAIARLLGLVHTAGVPGKYRDQYGNDTVWPTSLVVNSEGIVSYTTQSRRIMDRPDPQELLSELERVVSSETVSR